METAWIQVFVLTLTQCIAPAGKLVCQEETVQYRFTNEADCNNALVVMLELAERADNVLVDRARSDCRPAAAEAVVYADAAGAASSLADAAEAVPIDDEPEAPDFMQMAHEKRLATLATCEETKGVTPCKVGQIILEAPADAGDRDAGRDGQRPDER
jgi:hypothetical protein